ncbi:MAG: CoB--CoM heterodisulfide reductase iron-sulfur subunit B family protein [Promethearchaeota archaeon]|jgi:heterodisulfide reductase subunit B
MSFDLFLGCVIPARFPHLETSSRKVFEKLGIKLNDVDGFSCCPDPTGIELLDHKTWLSLGARNLSLANTNGGIMSFCSGCVETLKGVNYTINKDSHAKEEVNNVLKKVGKSYDGNVDVKHYAQVLHEYIDKVKAYVEKPLEGFKIAVHYGCHYLRPSEIINWDDPFEPKTVDELVRALGAESVDYEMKIECCGKPVERADPDLSLLMIDQKLKAIQKAGANCVVVVCPACYQQYEFSQRELNKKNESVVALALGFKPEELGFNFHRIRPRKLFETINFTP